MTFAAPSLLFGVFGALIPLILHLLFRRKPRIQALPTLRFIRIANQKVLKRHRLRRRLLLLARMLLVGLAALAMSRPFLETHTAPLDAKIEGDAVIVIDNSYFMMAQAEEGNLLDAARRIATTLIEQSPGRVSVLLTCDEKPAILTLSADKKAAYRFLESAHARQELGSLKDSVTRATQVLTDSASKDAPGTIFVVSSSTRLGQIKSSTTERSIRVVPINLTAGMKIDNAAIVNVDAGRAPQLGSDYWEVSVEMTYFGGEKRTADLTLNIPPNLELTTPVELLPGSTIFKSFQFQVKITDAVQGTVSLDTDNLSYDDRAAFWLTSNPTVKVLAVNGDFRPQPQDDELFYLERVLSDKTNNGDDFDFDSVPLESWQNRFWNRPDVVILANVPDIPVTLVKKLEDFVLNGGGLLVTFGDQLDPTILNRQLAKLLPRRIRGLRKAGDAAASEQGKDRKPSELSLFKESHEIFRKIPAPSQTSISKTLVSNYGLFSTDPSEVVEELITLENGAPLLLYGQKGRGRVIVLSTTIDRDWTDLPIQPDFVPFIQGVVRFLSRINMHPSHILAHGVPLRIAKTDDGPTRYTLEQPNGERRTVETRGDGGRWLQISNLEEVGHYRLVDTEENLIYFSVLPNTAASDLRAGSTEEMEENETLQSQIGAQNPTNIWPFLLIFLFVLIGVESRLAFQVSPSQES